MSNRIRELAQQAAEEIIDLDLSEAMITEQEGGNKITIPAAFIDKLGELIVQECIDVAYTEGDNVHYLADYMG